MLNFCCDAVLARAGLQRHGVWLSNEKLDREMCHSIRQFIDAVPSERAEINYDGSEKRIWHAGKESLVIADVAQAADRLISEIAGKPIDHVNVLAIRNCPVALKPELTDGRWHLDSIRRQIKVFVFLSDVDERSGPLEVLTDTHRPGFLMRHFLLGNLARPRDFLGDKRRYQRLDDMWVANVMRNRPARPIIGPAGTIAVVNTSAIHRARPCIEGERYALTVYYDRF